MGTRPAKLAIRTDRDADISATANNELRELWIRLVWRTDSR